MMKMQLSKEMWGEERCLETIGQRRMSEIQGKLHEVIAVRRWNRCGLGVLADEVLILVSYCQWVGCERMTRWGW
jgi:hypothetical protein